MNLNNSVFLELARSANYNAQDDNGDDNGAFWTMVLGLASAFIRLLPSNDLTQHLHFANENQTTRANSLGSNITLMEAIGKFSEYLNVTQKSHNTKRAYIGDAKVVLGAVMGKFFTETSNLDDITIDKITTVHIEAVENWLFDVSTHRPKTRERIKQGWNVFCTYIGMADWKMTKKTNVSCDYSEGGLTNPEIIKLLEYCHEEVLAGKSIVEKIRYQRIIVAINLGWAEGLRSCECGNANFREAELEGRITIRGSKNNGERVLPLSDQTRQAILGLKDYW